MVVLMVSEAVATAIFTITRLLYDSVLGVMTLILFSRLPGGSSAKFWYEQPDLVVKLTSLFHPFGPTGKRGVKFTNAIAVICTLLALALNILPTILSKLSPITTQVTSSVTNSTLSPISNIFIPTLTDINVPGLTKSITSQIATNKFLCSYVANGCLDSKSIVIAEINWDEIAAQPIGFFHNNSVDADINDVQVSINDSFATATTPQQYMFLAKKVFTDTNANFTNIIGQWVNNNLTGFYVGTMSVGEDATTPYNFVHADQISPLVTPDLADVLRQGRDAGAAMPRNGSIDRAERWVAVHRTPTLSSVLWQTVNAHGGQVGSDWLEQCFVCSLLDIQPESSQATSIANNLIAAATSTTNSTHLFALQSRVDSTYRLFTTLCLLQLNTTTNGLEYNCLHTYSQLWSIYHAKNPYNIIGNYADMSSLSATNLGDLGTPFPFFPPPTNITNDRTYIPIVPIFQIRSKGQCSTDWNYQTQSIENWMNDCAKNNLSQVNTTDLDAIAKNVWQISSTITVGGFLINATYFTHDVGIAIDSLVIVIVLASLVFALIGNLLLNLVTSPIHRRSLYEVIRVMVPDSRDPYYNVQKVLLDISPTNTLRLVDSIFDKRVSYLKLNNRLIVTLAEDQEEIKNDDISTVVMMDNTNASSLMMNEDQIQNWSRRQLLKF